MPRTRVKRKARARNYRAMRRDRRTLKFMYK